MLFLHSNMHQHLWNSLDFVNLAWLWPILHEMRRNVGSENHQNWPPTHPHIQTMLVPSKQVEINPKDQAKPGFMNSKIEVFLSFLIDHCWGCFYFGKNLKTLSLTTPQWFKFLLQPKCFTWANLYICHLYSCVEFCQNLRPYGIVTFQYRWFLPFHLFSIASLPKSGYAKFWFGF